MQIPVLEMPRRTRLCTLNVYVSTIHWLHFSPLTKRLHVLPLVAVSFLSKSSCFRRYFGLHYQECKIVIAIDRVMEGSYYCKEKSYLGLLYTHVTTAELASMVSS
eukprot:GFKZ01007423.1.p1 GENE.GFKZ01007423.1~~GFKZ01007423.1.p1  ORF type:complete len:105 (+),score=0.02 GFKZ01007423.1:103-417(+)